MSKKLSHDEFVSRLLKVNSNIEVLGEYITARIPIKCKCRIDNCVWEATPDSLLRGHGCPECGGSKKLSSQAFVERVYRINNNIEILNEYVNSKTNIKCKCKLDGYIWDTTPDKLFRGCGCPKCSRNAKKTHEEFLFTLKEINPNIEVVDGIYFNSKSKITCKCIIDGYIWTTSAESLLLGSGCKICWQKLESIIKTKSHEEFVVELHQINTNIKVIGQYINSKTPIKCECLIDGHIWDSLPLNLLRGKGCPLCNTSKGEKEILKFLELQNILFMSQKSYDNLLGLGGNLLSYDFYLPQYNLLIEYQGEQHERYVPGFHKSKKQFVKQQEHDKRKRDYAKQNNIQLLEIWYYDFTKITEILNQNLKF